jgi:isoquinoline 1-oxidoreductase beta subunit
MRIELPNKVTGTATYGIDIQVPGMLYGTVLRAPVEGSVPDKIDDCQRRKAIPGVTAVVRLRMASAWSRRPRGLRSPDGRRSTAR